MQSPDTIPCISAELIAEATSWRQHLHRNPELAFNERQTSEFVAERLTRFGLNVHRGLAGTGVVGTLTRGTSRRSLGIRADMDALPIPEQSGTTYVSSIPGIMHACGHDGHTAIALAAARICSTLPDLDGTVHFIFQPAEENEGGGRRMVEEGLFGLHPCDAVYALHNWPALPVGTAVARNGSMMAAFAVFEITISGRGCHGAMPHEGTDAIIPAAQLVSALQTIVSRNVDPLRSAVVSVTQIRAGDAWNATPDDCIIRGTTRWYEDAIGDELEERLTRLANSTAEAYGCRAQIWYDRRFPATVNDPASVQSLRDAARKLPLTFADVPPSMGSEDFAYMAQAVPACYVWLGAARSGDNPGLHSPRYDFNDQVLPFGIALWVSLVRHVLLRT